MNPRAYFEDCDSRYDEDWGLVRRRFTNPGYHTRFPTGEWGHQTVTSLEYAVLALRYGESLHRERAQKVLRTVISLQQTDPTHPHYGMFPYLAEEPLDKMALVDGNWADFCGMRLCEALVEPGADLPEDLIKDIRSALGHAAGSIFRRNIGPGYTNIAIMGGGLCAAVGEILDETWLLDYGCQRLQHVVTRADKHDGAFNEYNSPTYTSIALRETERILYLCKNEKVREAAEQLRHFAWKMIADHFHPGTMQWAGPHARAYQNLVDSTLAQDLGIRLGLEIPAVETQGDYVWTGPLDVCLEAHLPCPEEYRDCFVRLPSNPPYQIKQNFIHRDPESASAIGTTWFEEDRVLGSVSRDNFFSQRRMVLGYFRSGDPTPGILRLRFLHDGREFSSAYLRSAQEGPRVLSTINMLHKMGDYALHMDIPPEGIFMAEDFRLRYEMTASGASAAEIANGQFQLKAPGCRAIVHSLPGQFNGEPIQWTCGQDETTAWVDGVCYAGEKRGFRMEDCTPVQLASGLEFLRDGDEALNAGPEIKTREGLVYAVWPEAGIDQVDMPTETEPYLWAG